MGQSVNNGLKSCLLIFSPDKYIWFWLRFLSLFGILVGQMARIYLGSVDQTKTTIDNRMMILIMSS